MASVEVRNLHGEVIINRVVGPFPVSALKRVLKKSDTVVKLMLQGQILADDEVVGGVSKGTGTTEIVAVWCNQIYEVTLDRTSGENLGIGFLAEESGSLLVKGIREGLVRNWNAANPAMTIATDDHIVEVNGIQGDPNQLINALTTLQTRGCIQLKIRRPESLKEVTTDELAFEKSEKFQALQASCNVRADENSQDALAKDKFHLTCIACAERIDGTPIAQNDRGPLHFGCINQGDAWTRYDSC
jgi:hypothetical protein